MDPRLDMMSSAKKHKLPFTLLHIFTVLGDKEQVKRMVEGGSNPLDRDINNNTLLHFAAACGSLDILVYLIEDVGCNPDTKGWRGTTALHAAAEEGQLLVMKYLIEDYKMEVATTDSEGSFYPLDYACYRGNIEAVRYLVQRMREYNEFSFNDSEHNRQPVYSAAGGGQLDVVKYFIEQQLCDVSAVNYLLHLASYYGHLDIVRYLTLQHNCDPMMVHEEDLGNCLHTAAGEGHLAVVCFLVKHMKCDIYVKNAHNFYPIYCAAYSGNLELFRFFVEELCCDPLSEIDSRPWSALHVAAGAGHLSIVQYLIDTKKCDPMVCHDNETALLYSALHGQLQICKYFIERLQVEKDLKDCNGKTPLFIAAFTGQLPCVKYLLKIGWKHFDEKKNTPLHSAAAEGHLDVVKYLMDHHSNMYTSHPSKSPLYLATKHGQLDIVKYFIEDKKCDPFITANKNGATLLHISAGHGNTKLVRYLVEDVKFDHMIRDKLERCPLHYAATYGHIETFDYFISELKCEINTPAKNGELPIHCAITMRNSKLKFVQHLLKQPNCDVIGYSKGALISYLHFSAAYGHLDIVQYLLSHGKFDPFIQDSFGNTALHHAAFYDRLKVVQFIVNSYGSKSLQFRNCFQRLQPYGFIRNLY